jgi:hypothetical protein
MCKEGGAPKYHEPRIRKVARDHKSNHRLAVMVTFVVFRFLFDTCRRFFPGGIDFQSVPLKKVIELPTVYDGM